MSQPQITLGKPKQNGMCALTLYFRIKDSKEKIRFSIGIEVDPDEWDEGKSLIRGRSKEVQEKNMIISEALSRANAIRAEYYHKQLPLTAKIFKKEFSNPQTREDFLEYYQEEMMRQFNRRLFKESVLGMHQRTLKRLRKFQSPILFSEIDRKLIENFDAWHAKVLEKKGFEGIGQREKSLKYIRKYLNAAKNDGKKFTNPFQNFKWPRHKAEVVFLEEAEVHELLKLYRNEKLLKERMKERAIRDDFRKKNIENYLDPESVEMTRNYIRAFLFQCFTGVRDSDLRVLKHENIQEDLMIFTPVKTKTTSGKAVFFPVTPIMRELIVTKSGHLIRITSNQKYNQALKVVASLAGIKKNLTSHIGRHTFGTMMVANGVSLVSLTDLMGVTTIETVMIYAHSSLKQQKKEINRAIEKFIPLPHS